MGYSSLLLYGSYYTYYIFPTTVPAYEYYGI
jgi:hypothetical protein